MRRLVSLMLLLLWGVVLCGQSLTVAKYSTLENDLDARVNAPKMDAQTGKKSAIIKVVTTQQGFNFDIGQMAIVAVDAHPELTELWVYVPEGAKKIKIAHPQLGQLKTETDDGYFWFPSATKSAYCYRLELVSGTVTTTVEPPKQQMGYLLIESEPKEADVYITINGEEVLEGQTPFQKKLAYGTYPIRLRKTLYHDEPGVAVIDQQQVRINSHLQPAYGYLYITSDPSGARVSIEGSQISLTTPCTTDVMPSGSYMLRLSKEKYAIAQQQVEVEDGKTVPVSVNLKANFSTITITSLPGTTIYLNGSQVGTTSYTADLTPGLYEFETRLESHRAVTKQVEVETNHPQTITLNPTPIYGSLEVLTTPFDAEIAINGKTYGTTPKTIDNLLVGQYQVTVSKEGYGPETVTVTIEEGNTAEINRKLQNGKNISIASTPAGADLYVDGAKVGTTPMNLMLTYGNHDIKVKKQETEVTDRIMVSANMSKTQYSYEVNPKEQTFTVNGVSFKMIKVEGGTFTMGATSEQGSDADSDEKPTHQVTLSSYSIGQTEVTQALWKAVMGNNPSYYKGDNLPVEQVSWEDCQAFIRKLNQITGQNFRLPTESEWEYAARGGNKSQRYKYAGSNSIESVAWYDGNSSSQTHNVGTKKANELGLYDMSGNVWEWCQDWYGDYSTTSQTNPQGPNSGSYRVLRGGSWYYHARYCRVSYRNYSSPSYQINSSGLRLVLP